MPSVPTLEEMGVAGLVPEEKPDVKASAPEDAQAGEDYAFLNGMLFLSFVAPALFAKLMGWPLATFHQFVFVWVHEAGHGFFGLLGNRVVASAAGTFNELLFTLVPAAICLRDRRAVLGGLVLLMCAGLSVQHAGWYMMSAELPYGYGFGGIKMTPESHDWSVIFRELGFLRQSYAIGQATAEAGHALAVIFLIASLLGAVPTLYGWRPGRLFDIVSPSSLAALLYLLLSGSSLLEISIALLFTLPLAYRILLKSRPSD